MPMLPLCCCLCCVLFVCRQGKWRTALHEKLTASWFSKTKKLKRFHSNSWPAKNWKEIWSVVVWKYIWLVFKRLRDFQCFFLLLLSWILIILALILALVDAWLMHIGGVYCMGVCTVQHMPATEQLAFATCTLNALNSPNADRYISLWNSSLR